jgi:hypothetical protein
LDQFTRHSPDVTPRAHACEEAPHLPLAKTSLERASKAKLPVHGLSLANCYEGPFLPLIALREYGIARFSRHAGICAAVEATPLLGSRAGPTATEPIPDCSRATTDTFTAAIIFLIGCALRTASSSHERGMNAGNAVTPRRAGLVPIWPALLVSIL